MGLLSKQTDLKSFKFGVPPATDRRQGGNSGEPYIKKSIDRNIVPQSEDFLLRGGINAPLDAATDVARLGKFFSDLKSPRGALFVAKQNLLSRTGVATQASNIIDWKNAPLNEGVYTPLTTLAQAGVGFSGGHLPKQGAIPFMGVRTYTDAKFQVIGAPNGEGNRLVDFYNEKIDKTNLSPNLYSYSGGPNSDLGIGKTNIYLVPSEQRTGINNPKIKNSGFFPVPTPPPSPEAMINLDPGILGSPNFNFTPETTETGQIPKSGFSVFKRPPIELRKNTILFLNDNTVTNKYASTIGIFNVPKSLKNGLNPNNESVSFQLDLPSVYNPGTLTPRSNISTYQVGLKNSNTDRDTLPTFYSPLTNEGVTKSFEVLTPFFPPGLQFGINNGNNGRFGREFETSVYKPNPNNQEAQSLKNSDRVKDNGASTWEQFRIENSKVKFNSSDGVFDPKIQDFREPLLRDKKISTIMGISPSYSDPNKRIEGSDGSRINQSSPGQSGNRINYTRGKIIGGNNDGTGGRVSVVDRINFQPLYSSKNVLKESSIDKNDLIKFRIGAILRDSKKVYMHFRAFINSFSDAYSADWSGIKYMGRGEEFYKYGGFGRKISLSYTVAAQSKPELMAQYKKLNFLASTLAPDYGSSGYMGGVLTTLTLGGWCYELPGFISSLTLEVPQESPWEIAIPANEKFADTGNPIYSDKTVKEMPHICNVSMDFTPIHTFRPELQKNGYGSKKAPDGLGEVSKYGKQRFLELTNGHNNNYIPVSLNQAQQPIITNRDMNKQSAKGET